MRAELHTCATDRAIQTLARDGRPASASTLQAMLGGVPGMGALGLPMYMFGTSTGEFIGWRFLDADGRHAVQVWLAWNDTFTIERCVDGQPVGVVESIYFDQVADYACRASCFRDTPFGDDHPDTTLDERRRR